MTRFPYIASLFLVFLLFCCTQVERDNPYDPDGVNYNSGGNEPSSDSYEGGEESSSSSEPGSLAPSSSSLATISSSLARSSSSSVRSSSGGTSSVSVSCNRSGYCLYASGECYPVSADDCCEYGIIVANQAACSSTAVKFCSYGTCVGGNGWECSGSGGCYMINNSLSEASCRSTGTVVDCCPADTRPPSADYPACSIISSSSLKPLSSSSVAPSSSSLVPISSSLSVVVSSSSVAASGIFVDERDGQNYRWVKIGTQIWFAENLNFAPSSGTFISCDIYDCVTYGRLYDWSTAMTVCPSGWHLPSQAEWNTLISYVESTSGCSSCDARLLKKTSGWNNNGNGTDTYGFSALPGGGGDSDGSFSNVGNHGFWLSASESGFSYSAYIRVMSNNVVYAYWNQNDMSYLYSVRCLQN